ncbi:hypothetical protein AL036_09500 [Salipiger aestuarii]|uniref:Uncharacterized protein n=1 Tax=Salipiger aestuarii TaxID=568098 RepID=A0A327Y4E4_9RHOB|nr:hypothetical protein [Salipiger aestuarii]KAA8607713.1 hypothetical protein AL036_09500 [Salipiger aestuarii]KAB2541980.1 hypothetical protein AL035_09235 [Salipiger aestuarii]RAK15634.1 hypothetical protein ATI53_102157 [Salipiger aestuarii]
MDRMKLWMAQLLVGLVVVVGLGFGLVAMAVALAFGLVISVAVRMAGPQILAEAERRASELRAEAARPVT